MSTIRALKQAFAEALQVFDASRPIRRLARGELTLTHYQWFLRETFHYTREDPQLQALAASKFRGSQRDLVEKFFRHATSEIGHERLALADLAATGVDVRCIPYENPLPNTRAFTAFALYQTCEVNPLAYLGYLFFLEFLPTASGAAYIEYFRRAGVPGDAFTFIHDHTRVDVAHNRLMEDYVAALIQDDVQLGTVVYAMRATGQLYAQMVDGAFVQADCPVEWGNASNEVVHGYLPSFAA
jgi:Iron-containing redox enzyme